MLLLGKREILTKNNTFILISKQIIKGARKGIKALGIALKDPLYLL